MSIHRIFFDCDSTLSAIEGLEAIAGPERREEIARVTELGMSGGIAFEESLTRRLSAIRPDRRMMEELAALYVEHAVEDARGVVSALHAARKEVYLVSGGIAPAVRAFGRWLGVPEERVRAVEIRLEAGRYAGLVPDQPLARQGGKRRVIADLTRGRSEGSALIGDGVTDAEAADVVSVFIGYGGVVARKEVRARAKVFIRSRSLAAVLPLVLGVEERDQLANGRHGPLVEKGDRLMGEGQVEILDRNVLSEG